jgi:hypothetical protein
MSKRARLEHRQQRQAELARKAELAAQRRRLGWAAASVAVVLVIIGTLVVVKLTAGSSPPAAAAPPSSSSNEVQQAIAKVPADALNKIGLGAVDTLPKALSGQAALTADGKPLIVYIGAEYCPYCAAQRWGLAVALSRFGTFTGLGQTSSSSIDAFPSTATLSFHGATYTSQYIVFQGVETTSNVRQGDGYAPLDTPTDAQNQLMKTYDTDGSIPFLDIANKYVMSGASISPALLQGKAGIEIADLLSTPDDPIAKAVGGSANAFTAAICDATGGQPAAVCTSSAVTAYQAKLHG